MSLSFCSAFGGAAPLVAGGALGTYFALKIGADPSSIDDATFTDIGAQAADASALCDTDGGSFESTAGNGGGGDGGEP